MVRIARLAKYQAALADKLDKGVDTVVKRLLVQRRGA
ncbi:MAG: hypothetical protein BWY57_02503 [Betaproteobacteria bacterium ADurb.Bin341]|nr:MAG: hypothetical protein BWY57_02503 [Betaproteobacteria bacterium ADurb.Bin341]